MVNGLYVLSPDIFDAVYTPVIRKEIQFLIDNNDEVTDLVKVTTDDQVESFTADSCLLQNSLQISLYKILPKADE